MTGPSTTQSDAPRVTMAHGGGGEMTKQLIQQHFLPRLGNKLLNPLADSATIPASELPLAFTTDSFVVLPLEFPGGDIGRLAVCGTVNDLAVMGAVPTALSLALTIEEGLPLSTLDRIIDSVAQAAREADVVIATGDTKVIERRSGDGLTITTAGIGRIRRDARLDLGRVVPGDVVMISGRIADHGLAIMSVREGLAFDTSLESDAAPLNHLIGTLLDTGSDVKFLRDPTRGGLAGVVADIAEDTGLTVELDEAALPISPTARHTAEVFGLDPMTVANEGKCLAIVAAGDAKQALSCWQSHPLGRDAAIVGRITDAAPPLAELLTHTGGRRVIQRPYGEELPRIC